MTIEEIRKQKRILGYTNATLSDLTCIPMGTLNKILSGDTKNPRPENMKALEDVLFGSGKFYGNSDEEHPVFAETPSVYGAKKTDAPQEKGPGDYTIDDYYALPDDQRVELIDGVFYDMAAPTVEHQLLAGSVYAQLLAFIRSRKGKCIPLVSPVDVKLDEDNKTMVQPDVVVVCDREKITERVVLGGPDFVLEVVSPSSVTKDYIKKAAKYEAAGVREYWIVDPLTEKVIKYDLEEGSSPSIYPLAGKVSVSIVNNEIEIDFDEYKEFL